MDDITPYDLAALVVYRRSQEVLADSPRSVMRLMRMMLDTDVWAAIKALDVIEAQLGYIHRTIAVPPLERYRHRLLAIQDDVQRSRAAKALAQIFEMVVVDYHLTLTQNGGSASHNASRSLN